MSTFSTREIAIAVWSLAIFAVVLSIKSVRNSLWEVLKQALFSKLALVWISLAAYAALLVAGLAKLGVWTDEHVKDTIVWFVFGAITYPFQFHDPEKAPRVLRALLRDSLSVLIIVEVLIETYTFSLPVELVLVPVTTLIATLGAVAETRDEHKPVARILGTVQAVIGFALLGIVVQRAYTDPALTFLPALLTALIVVVLSLACYPYVQGLRLAFAYEGMLWRIGWKQPVSRRFRHYAALRILRHVRFRPGEITPFIRRNAFSLFDVGNRADLDSLLEADNNVLNNVEMPRGRAA